jgi:LCP family protein required for cell wall assembly
MKWAGRIAGLVSILICVVSVGAFYLAQTASKSVPRSKALQGAPQSPRGDTNILLLGLDSRRANDGTDLPRKLLDLLHVGSSSAVGGYNTNTMILIHIPANGSKAVAISIPRDDYVAVAGMGMKKIKEAYGLAKYASETQLIKQGIPNPKREFLSREVGRTATIATIHTLLGVPIDHFAEVNLVGFYDLATALGGIEVCLKRAVNDLQYSGAVFPAGLQTITGADALKFVRQRHGLPNGDLDRTHRQQAFITGVITKFRSEGIFGDIGKIQTLLDVAKKDVVIDSGWDVLGFLPQAKALSGGHITFYTLPIEGYAMRNGQSVNLIDKVKVKAFVQAIFYPPKIKTPSLTSGSSKTSSTTGATEATTAPKPKKTNYAELANGMPVQGGKIPCVN